LEAAFLMTKRKVGSAVVLDPDRSGIASSPRVHPRCDRHGQNPDTELRRRISPVIRLRHADLDTEQAAEAMTRGGFRT
jgi:hypothetical protein